MPKATITTGNGAKVTIEGTQEEVAALLMKFEGPAEKSSAPMKVRMPQQDKSKSTPMGLLSELIEGEFFSRPKDLNAVRLALEEKGHFYPVTSLSPAMLRLVRRKELRRIKDKKHWSYVI